MPEPVTPPTQQQPPPQWSREDLDLAYKQGRYDEIAAADRAHQFVELTAQDAARRKLPGHYTTSIRIGDE